MVENWGFYYLGQYSSLYRLCTMGLKSNSNSKQTLMQCSMGEIVAPRHWKSLLKSAVLFRSMCRVKDVAWKPLLIEMFVLLFDAKGNHKTHKLGLYTKCNQDHPSGYFDNTRQKTQINSRLNSSLEGKPLCAMGSPVYLFWGVLLLFGALPKRQPRAYRLVSTT